MLSFNVLPSNTMRMGQAICTIPGLVGVDPVEQFLDEWNRSIWFWIIDHPTKKLGTCLRYPLVTCSRDMFWSDNPVGLALLKKKKGYWPSWTSAKMIRCIPIHRAPNQKMLTTQVALLMMMTLQLHLRWQMPSMMSVVEIFACTLIKIISKLCPQDDGYKSQDEKWTIMMISIVHSKGRGFYPSTQMRNDEHYLGFSGSVHLYIMFTFILKKRTPSIPMAIMLPFHLPTSLLSSKGSTVGKAMRGVQAHAAAPWPKLHWQMRSMNRLQYIRKSVLYLLFYTW